jgi:hypothetical protein
MSVHSDKTADKGKRLAIDKHLFGWGKRYALLLMEQIEAAELYKNK